MGLIDANITFQRFVKETEDSKKDVIHINTIKRILQDIDIAYDLEKVLYQLKEAETDVSSLGHYAIHTDDAIKIALKGGV